MADITIAAVLRAGIFSPNHIANDAAILHATADELRRRGCLVNVYSESEFVSSKTDEDVILATCRGENALKKLQLLEDMGKIVFNSGYGIENCVRMIMIRLLADAGIPIPESYVVDTDVEVRRRLVKSGITTCWVKRADSPVLHLEDICRCRHPEEAQEILHEFFFRGIRRAVVSRDVPGEKIRFYGIESSGWFHCFMPMRPVDSADDSADIQEALQSKIKALCMKAAKALRVNIFGGDIVLTPEGHCMIVNFDDWPSFAPIRKEAAKAIAKSVLADVRSRISKRRRS